MKRKIKITSKQVKRIVLLVLLVAVVVLLGWVTIKSFNKNHVSSNSTVPNASVVSGDYEKYIQANGDNYPSNYVFSIDATKNKAIKATYDKDATKAYNLAQGEDADSADYLTGRDDGSFTDDIRYNDVS